MRSGLGDLVDRLAYPSIETAQPTQVGGGGGVVGRGAGRVGLAVGVADGRDVALHQGRVEPEVRVRLAGVERRLAGLWRPRGDAGGRRHERRPAARLVQHRQERALQAAAVHDHQVGAGDGAQVRRRRLEGMGVGAVGHELPHREAARRDVLCDVAQEARRRHDVEAAGAGGLLPASAGPQGEDGEHRGQQGGAARPRRRRAPPDARPPVGHAPLFPLAHAAHTPPSCRKWSVMW